MKKILFTLIALMTLGLLSSTSYAASRLVPGSYATLQAAIDASASGDEVHVTAANTYEGAATITSKNLSIIGDVAGVVIHGTITSEGSSVVTLNNIKIYDSAFDGVVQNSTGALTITNCVIDYNPGRGILHLSGGDITMTGSTISGSSFWGYDRAGGTGGKFTASGNCVFIENQAGLMVESGTNPTIELSNCEIKNNTSVGIYVTGAATVGTTINVSNSTLLNNRQDQVLLMAKVNLSMTNVNFTHTVKPTFMAGIRMDGTAPAADTSTVQLTGCTFTCPYSYVCMWMGHAANLTVNQCSFTGYSSTINVVDNATALATIALSDSQFSGNTSVPLSINGIDDYPTHVLTADRCRFTGGAAPFNLINALSTQATLTNCVFDGGDTQVWSQGTQAWLKARNCTLVGDAVTSSGLHFGNSSAEHLVANCIIDKTRLGLDGAEGVTVVNHHNMIRANEQNFVTITAGASTQENVDPQFVTASTGHGTGDFHLKATSPAKNAGDATLGVTVDYDKLARGAKVDIGAYEYPEPFINASKYWNLY